MPENRGLLPEAVGETFHLEKSPFVQGFLTGLKGALFGAPVGALVQHVRGQNPLLGALIGGLGAGLAAGATKYVSQDLENVSQEEALRYYAQRLKAREPMLFMPPPPRFGQIFRRFHNQEHGRAS